MPTRTWPKARILLMQCCQRTESLNRFGNRRLVGKCEAVSFTAVDDSFGVGNKAGSHATRTHPRYATMRTKEDFLSKSKGEPHLLSY
jgi:hypothetical protein